MLLPSSGEQLPIQQPGQYKELVLDAGSFRLLAVIISGSVRANLHLLG